MTAAQINDLATSLMKKSGIDDETIKSGENLLLTFTNIRNEVGKGNDIFDQATKTVVDMSVALGEDMKSASIQVGKALNDPINGLTALRRVGVSFTDAQKEQIKAMVESGHTMDAQKIILHELTKEFGGSAEAVGKTLPGQINIAKETFNNFAGDLVAKMIPAITNMVNYIRDHWPEISATAKQIWLDVKPILANLIDLVDAVVDAIRDHWSTIGPIVKGAAHVLEDAAKIIATALKLVTDLLHGDWSAAWRDAKAIVSTELDLIKTEVLTAVNAIRSILQGAAGALKDAGEGMGRAIVNGISSGLSALGGALHAAIVDPINAVIDRWNSIGFDIPGISVFGHKFGGEHIGVPQIPHLAAGGIVNSPTLALIGERGPEAVVPLGHNVSGITVNINGPVYGADADELARKLNAALARHVRRGGKLGFV